MEMEDQNIVNLSDYLKIATDLESGAISPEESDIEISRFFSKLIIKDYMAHSDKLLCLGKILFALDNFTDEIACTGNLECMRVSYGLLSYCTNLKNDVEPIGVLFVVNDLIHQYGLYNYILKYCEQDYNLFSRMLSDMINISHIKQLTESAALFDNAAFDEWTKGMKDLSKQLTPELLEGLMTFNSVTDGSAQDLLSSLAKAAVDESTIKIQNSFDLIREIEEKNANEKEPLNSVDEK